MGMLEVFVMKFRTITKHTLPMLFNKAKQQAEATTSSSTTSTTDTTAAASSVGFIKLFLHAYL